MIDTEYKKQMVNSYNQAKCKVVWLSKNHCTRAMINGWARSLGIDIKCRKIITNNIVLGYMCAENKAEYAKQVGFSRRALDSWATKIKNGDLTKAEIIKQINIATAAWLQEIKEN